MEKGFTIVLEDNGLLSEICGANDGNLKAMEDLLGARVLTRGNEMLFESQDEALQATFVAIVERLADSAREGRAPSVETRGPFTKASGVVLTPNASSRMLYPFLGFGRIFPGASIGAVHQGHDGEGCIILCRPRGHGENLPGSRLRYASVLTKNKRKLVLTGPSSRRGELIPSGRSLQNQSLSQASYDAMIPLCPRRYSEA